MDSKKKLEILFKNFPSVGPKQAERMVLSLLYKNQSYLKEISDLIYNLKNEFSECKSCNLFFQNQNKKNIICKICSDQKRDYSKILIVEKDTDVSNIEKSEIWNGLYFVLGKNLKINEKNFNENFFNLKKIINKNRLEILSEITFALSVNPEGENTKENIINILKPYSKKYNFKITQLGRGLSLGSEIEHSDKITLLEAFKNIK